MTYYMVPEQKKKRGNFGDNFGNVRYISEIIPKVTSFFYSGIEIVQLDTTRK